MRTAVVLPKRPRPPPSTIKPPRFIPKDGNVERRVFAPEKLWAALSETAEFHDDTFKELLHAAAPREGILNHLRAVEGERGQ